MQVLNLGISRLTLLVADFKKPPLIFISYIRDIYVAEGFRTADLCLLP